MAASSSVRPGRRRRAAASTVTVNRGKVAKVRVPTATPDSCTEMKNVSQWQASSAPLMPSNPQACTGKRKRLRDSPPSTSRASTPKPARMAVIQTGATSSLPYRAAVPKITAAILIASRP